MEVHHSIHLPKWKKDEIEDIKNKVAGYRVIGIAGIRGIQSSQLQQMRKNLRGTAVLKICRNTLIDRALDEAGGEVKAMRKYVSDQTALIFTNENPFKLYRLLEKSKISAPIKPGAVAQKDIGVHEGPTSFSPGPIVGELQSAGIPAGIEGGKVVIHESRVVVRRGEKVSSKLAGLLSRLDIRPVDLGLDLKAALEGGTVFEPRMLAIDEARYSSDFTLASQRAFNLSVNAAYPARATVSTLLARAAYESRNLAINTEIFSPDIVDVLLSRAYGRMMALAGVVSERNPDGLGVKLKEKLGIKR